MAKKKNKTKGGPGPKAHKGLGQQQRQSPANAFTGTNSIFTLADEARQTGQHDHSFWNQETKLRSIPVSFISAGVSEPLKTDHHPDDNAEVSDRRPETATPDVIDTPEEKQEQLKTSELHEEENELFFYDTGRGPVQENNETLHAERDRTATPETEKSDSEGEVILFKGRLNVNREKSDTIDMKNMRTEISAVEREIEHIPVPIEEQKQPERSEKQKKSRGRRSGKQVKARRAATAASDEEDDGLLADYIANMRENGEMHELLGTTGISEGTDDESESGSDSTVDDGPELPVEAFLAMQPVKQTSSWASRENVMEYTDFDPMDWERPSIRRKKGKGAKHTLDLRFADIDSETERSLQATWRSDRLRKAERKKEREQLRALNLIGKKADKSDGEDMRVKYPKGMSLEQVADELKRFLLSSDNRNSICLPPMDKHARKMIHELANKFNVKSKSIGKADQRRPTLYRTKRTLRFDNEAFELAVRRIHRRYFPRLDYKGKSSKAPSSRNGYAEASYRDGEIVGASAPELSTENRGRAMLEKMGWSTGTALGSLDNKGILQPVTQTMKRSKAGLG